ncbi:hypothetical protein [Actinocorallia longicatena]|uniref:Serine/threonine protein kinase n=1 Tax=Actinocorallia longicatena TaxID=111803 RepID=A0ABP6QIG5_9ACTN
MIAPIVSFIDDRLRPTGRVQGVGMSGLKGVIAVLTCAVIGTLSFFLTRPGTEVVTGPGPTAAASTAPVSSNPAPSTRVPGELVGSWAGTALGPNGQQQVALTLKDGVVGEVVGESTVPGSDCVFELKLDSVDRQAVFVTERTRTGSKCTPSSGRIGLVDGGVRYSTRTPDGDTVSGRLSKA